MNTLARDWADARARALELLWKFDEGQHPRDEHGRWTDSGAGDSSTPTARPPTSKGAGASDKAFAKIKAAVNAIPAGHAAQIAHVPVTLAATSDDFPSHIAAGGGSSTVGLFGWAGNKPRIEIAEAIKAISTITEPAAGGKPAQSQQTETLLPIRQPEQVTVHELAHAFDYVNDWRPSADLRLKQSFAAAVKQMTETEAKNANYWVSGGQREMFAELYSQIYNPNHSDDQTFFGGLTWARTEQLFAPAIAHILQVKRFDAVRRAAAPERSDNGGYFVNEAGELYVLINGVPYALDVAGTALAKLELVPGSYPDLDAVMRAARVTKFFDESEHPRDENGRFTDAGGVAFVSPNKEDLKFDGAVEELESRRQNVLRHASYDVDRSLGKDPVDAVNVVGAWSDGAENSLALVMPKGWSHEQVKVAMAMKGWLGDQKSALIFTPDAGGNSYMATIALDGDLAGMHKELLDGGLAFHTIEPTKDGALVHVWGDDQATMDAVDALAEKHDVKAEFTYGNGEFIGTTKQDGTDREQRDDARRAYEAIIGAPEAGAAFDGRDVEKVWQDVRDRWGGELSTQSLTSEAILAEAGTVKPNSRKVTEIAKDLNARASEILNAHLGLSYVDTDNHTPQTDDYLAGVIAQELKDGLTNGHSAVDWYDQTMKEAMATAAKLYPGVATDPDRKFAFTVALAITSQGEVVDSSVRLADQAYKYFEQHGKFPTDMKAADPNVAANMKKVNAFIDKIGLAKTRELFDSQMTVKELKAATGYKVGGLGVNDTVYGSAVLGPKIGNGFYQNLNGNFSPITMDLWFMRSWGRITNTGIGDTDLTPLYERLNDALKQKGEPVPKTEAGTLDLARQIYAEHEKNFAKYRSEYKSGERKKTEDVFASERLVLHADGAMVEQPKGVAQRRWITDVFHKAIGKLKDEGIAITPASAQATWWWPEKVLYSGLGVRVRELDMDYAKSLKKMAESRGYKSYAVKVPDDAVGYASWIDDPDPPDYLTDEEIEAMAEQAAKHFGKPNKPLDENQREAWRVAKIRAIKHMKTGAHGDWMDECVPTLMNSGKDQIVAVAACLNMWRDAWEESHPDGADDPGPSPKPADDESPLAKDKTKTIFARARALLRLWNEADHPRVPAGSPGGGQFGEGGGGGESARREGETDKEFAKRVVDKRPAPKELPEKYDDYFKMDGAVVMPLDRLVSGKSADENKQGGENGAKRMAAAAKGELAKRDPITVEPMADGKYLITDGNGTFTTVQKYGWQAIPVQFAGGAKADLTHQASHEVVNYKAGLKAEAATMKKVREQWVAESSINTIEDVKRDAPIAQATLGNVGPEIAAKLGVTYKHATAKTQKFDKDGKIVENPKGVARILEKIAEKEQITGEKVPMARITDAARGTFVLNQASDARKVVDELAKTYEMIDEGWRTIPDTHYTDRPLLFRDRQTGLIGEIQLANPDMLKAKDEDGGHEMYEEARVLPNGNPRKDELHAQMQKLYGAVLNKLPPEWRAIDGRRGYRDRL